MPIIMAPIARARVSLEGSLPGRTVLIIIKV